MPLVAADPRRLRACSFDYITTRTRSAATCYAVGGNAEAARRAGISVDAHAHVGVRAARRRSPPCGGILAASRLLAVNQSSGGSDLLLLAIAGPVIAGMSLFGGRGSVWAALLGALVIGSISNGMDLLALESSVKFMVTGGVLLAAVVARRDRAEAAARARQVVRVRVGLLSTAKINTAILRGARLTDAAEVVAVASRDGGRAEAYAREHGIDRAHGSYEALLADEASTRSTSRCRTRCTSSGRSGRWRPASTCCARSR